MSMSGGILGTPAYVAPEIWNGEAATPATDIYALGCVLAEMVTGRPLFAGRTPFAIMALHAKPPNYPANWPEDAPPGIESMLDKALAKAPDDRYATAGAFAQALTHLDRDPLADRYEQMQEKLAAGQWDEAISVGEALIAANPDYRDVPALLATATQKKGEAQQAEWIAGWQQQAEAAMAAEEWETAQMAARQWLQLAPGNTMAETLMARAQKKIQEPKQKPVIETAQAQPDPTTVGQHVYTKATPTPKLVEPPTTDSTPSHPPPSSNQPPWGWMIVGIITTALLIWGGSRLAGSSSQSDHVPDHEPVRLGSEDLGDEVNTREIFIEYEDGSRVYLTNNEFIDSGDAKFSPDGSLIAFSRTIDTNEDGTVNFDDTSDIYVMDINGNNVRNLTNHPADDGMFSWSPDGNQLVFSSNRSGSFEVYLFDLSSNTIQQLTYDAGWGAHPAWSPDGQYIAFYTSDSNGSYVSIMPPNGSGYERLTDSVGNGWGILWTTDNLISFPYQEKGRHVISPDGSSLRELLSSEELVTQWEYGWWEE
jgi:serine/threonine protein kinase